MAVCFFEAPIFVAHLRAVGNQRAGATPQFPIERGWRRDGRGVGGAGSEMDLGINVDDAAERAGGDKVADRVKGGALAALKTDLHNAAALGGCIEHRAAFTNVVGERFFAVDVESALHGGDKGQRVPLGWCGDDDAFEPGRGEKIGVVFERERPRTLEFFNLHGGAGEVLAVDIAKCADLGAAGLEGGLDVDHAPPAAADETEFDRARGGGRGYGRGGGLGQSGRGFCLGGFGAEGGESSRAEGGGTEELAAVEGFHEVSF